MAQIATNTLYCDIECPKCGKKVSSGIGFRAGTIRGHEYKIGEKLDWQGPKVRPTQRPSDGNLKTIGYFECDNLQCQTWQDCYPEIQEALIVIEGDVIAEAKPTTHRPGEQELAFDIIEPKDVT